MALQQPGAAVPAKNSIVVSRGTNQLGLREAVHRLREKWGKSVRRASRGHLRFRPPFMQQPGVVEAFVAVSEPLKEVFYFSGAIRCVSAELVSNRQAQQAKCQLVFGLDCKDVAADRFSLFRFIERAVEFCLRDGFRNTGVRD